MKIIVNSNEVFWVFGTKINPGPQAISAIERYVGSYASVFLPVNLGMGIYSWELPDDGWERYSQIHSGEDAVVKQAYSALCRNVHEAVKGRIGNNAEAFVNNVFTVPNDDYVFYKIDADGKVQFLISAWGFRNVKKPSGGPLKKDIIVKKNQFVKCGFAIDGVLQPNRAFVSHFEHQQVPSRLVTLDDGYYSYSSALVEGETVVVADEKSGKRFELVVKGGQEEYIFDVTDMCNVNVNVKRDGEPLSDENVQLTYNDKQYNVTTDENGVAAFNIPILENKMLDVVVNGEEQQQEPNSAGNSFFFEFTTTPEPVAKKATLTVNVKSDGEPVCGEPVKISYAGNDHLLNTDAAGTISLELEYDEIKVATVDVRGSILQKDVDGEVLLFEYDFFSPSSRTVTVGIVDAKGEPITGNEVTISQGEKKEYFNLDESGKFRFLDSGYKRGEEVVVTVVNSDGSKTHIPFVLEPDEDEYLLEGELKKRKSFLFLWILLLLIATVVCAILLFEPFESVVSEAGNSLLQMLN